MAKPTLTRDSIGTIVPTQIHEGDTIAHNESGEIISVIAVHEAPTGRIGVFGHNEDGEDILVTLERAEPITRVNCVPETWTTLYKVRGFIVQKSNLGNTRTVNK